MDDSGSRRLQRLRDAFEAALRSEGTTRARVLDAFCAGHPELRPRIEAMLRSADAAPPALDSPSAAAGATPRPPRLRGFSALEPIGRGGMGEVFRSTRLHDGRAVAVKLPHLGVGVEGRVRRLRREASILAQLHHPSIVRLLGQGESRGVPYLVLELVEEGRPIDEYALARRLGLDERIDLVIAIADGLAEAHARGFVHRDLKPRNVLVDRLGRPRLLDFGIAKATLDDLEQSGASTSSQQVVGSLEAMSPEQLGLVKAPVNAQSDLFQLALILHRLAIASDATGVGSSLRMIARGGRLEPIPGDPRLARPLQRVIGAALRRHPSERHGGIEAFAADLRDLRRGTLRQPRAPGLLARLRLRIERWSEPSR